MRSLAENYVFENGLVKMAKIGVRYGHGLRPRTKPMGLHTRRAYSGGIR